MQKQEGKLMKKKMTVSLKDFIALDVFGDFRETFFKALSPDAGARTERAGDD
jgi:hypothetical protein